MLENQKLQNNVIEADAEENYISKIQSQGLQIKQLKQNVNDSNGDYQILAKSIKQNDKSHDRRLLMLRALLVGNIILNLLLLLFFTISSKYILYEVISDFNSFFLFIINLVAEVMDIITGFIDRTIDVSTKTTQVISIVMLMIFMLLFTVLIKCTYKIIKKKSNHATYYYKKGASYKLFKRIVSIDIAISLYVFIIVFYKEVINVFSYANIYLLWVVFTALGIASWNIKDWINGFKE